MYTRTIIILLLSLGIITACSKSKEGAPDQEQSQGPPLEETRSYINEIVLKWEALSGATKYEVRYAETEGMEDPTVVETNKPGLTIQNLKRAHAYFIQVRGRLTDDWTSWSNVSRVSTATFEAAMTTYNILGIEADPVVEPEFAWHLRKDALKSMILQANNNPDIICFQETALLAGELSDMLAADYDTHISAREVSARVIAWKPDKFSLVSYDDDLDIFGTEVSGRDKQRYVSHVRLKALESGKEVLVYNVHIPASSGLPKAEGQRIRSVGTRNLATHVKKQQAETGLPVVIMGDFNNYPGTVIDGNSSSFMIMNEQGIEDTFETALTRSNADYSTTVNRATSTVKPGENGDARIDYIFSYPSDKVTTSAYEIVINFEAGSSTRLQKPVPSDHHPVRSVLQFTY